MRIIPFKKYTAISPGQITMAEKPDRWRIHLRKKKAVYIGTVSAPDAQAAIKVAVMEFGIADADRQKRLIALPEEERKLIRLRPSS